MLLIQIIETLTAIADVVGVIILVLVVLAMIRRSKGKEYQIIKLGAIISVVSVFLFFGFGIIGGHYGSSIMNLGISVGTVILYYGMLLFLKKTRSLPSSSHKESPPHRPTP